MSSGLHETACDDIDDNYSESLFVEITASNDEKVIVRIIYRPPDADFAVFSTKLEERLYFFN